MLYFAVAGEKTVFDIDVDTISMFRISSKIHTIPAIPSLQWYRHRHWRDDVNQHMAKERKLAHAAILHQTASRGFNQPPNISHRKLTQNRRCDSRTRDVDVFRIYFFLWNFNWMFATFIIWQRESSWLLACIRVILIRKDGGVEWMCNIIVISGRVESEKERIERMRGFFHRIYELPKPYASDVSITINASEPPPNYSYRQSP